jgi:hypothetical protein
VSPLELANLRVLMHKLRDIMLWQWRNSLISRMAEPSKWPKTYTKHQKPMPKWSHLWRISYYLKSLMINLMVIHHNLLSP